MTSGDRQLLLAHLRLDDCLFCNMLAGHIVIYSLPQHHGYLGLDRLAYDHYRVLMYFELSSPFRRPTSSPCFRLFLLMMVNAEH